MSTENSIQTPEEEPDEETVEVESGRRRWLSFGLRTMLILLVVSAFVINFLRLAKIQKDAVARLKESGAQIVYHHELTPKFEFESEDWELLVPTLDEQSAIRKQLRNLLGSYSVDKVAFASMVEKAKMKPVDDDAWLALRSLNYIRPFKGVVVEVESDSNVESVSQFESLTFLRLSSYFRGSLKPLTQLQDVRHFDLAIRTPEVDWLGRMPNLEVLKVRKILPAPHLSIDIAFLKDLQRVERLEFRALSLTSAETLSQMKNVRYLRLTHTETSDLSPLSGLAKLEVLNLSNSFVSDVDQLVNMNLKQLILRDSPVTDVKGIANMKTLTRVDVRNTLLTEVDVENLRLDLKKSGANCEVMSGGQWVEE